MITLLQSCSATEPSLRSCSNLKFPSNIAKVKKMVEVNNLLNKAFSRIGEKKIPSRRKIAKNNVPGKTTEKCEIYFHVSRSWWQLCSGLKVDLMPSCYNCPVINALTCSKPELWPSNRIKWSSRMLKSFYNSFKSLRKADYQVSHFNQLGFL